MEAASLAVFFIIIVGFVVYGFKIIDLNDRLRHIEMQRDLERQLDERHK